MSLAQCSTGLWAATIIYNHYNRSSQRRVWQPTFETVAAAGPVSNELSIDSRHIKAHRAAEEQAKMHELDDDRGRPGAFALTPGNVADISMVIPLSGAIARPKRLWRTKLTTLPACAHGSSTGRLRRSFYRPTKD